MYRQDAFFQGSAKDTCARAIVAYDSHTRGIFGSECLSLRIMPRLSVFPLSIPRRRKKRNTPPRDVLN